MNDAVENCKLILTSTTNRQLNNVTTRTHPGIKQKSLKQLFLFSFSMQLKQ